MSRSAAASQARLVNAYCSMQSCGVVPATSTARSTTSPASASSCTIPSACACAGLKISPNRQARDATGSPHAYASIRTYTEGIGIPMGTSFSPNFAPLATDTR
jgi:hypothetical protein